MKKICVVLLVCMVSLVVQADLYMAGDFNGWDPAGQMMTDNSDGTFTATVTGLDAGSRHEFKITDGTWDWNYPGANSWFYADSAGQITITFNTNSVSDGWEPAENRIGLDYDQGFWTIAGSFQGWDNANPATAMTSLGDGTYMFSQELDAGEYWFKPVVTGSWDSISWDGRSVGTSNYYINLMSTQILNVYVDALAGTMRTEIIPEPATMTLLGLGSLMLASFRRKK